MKRLVTLAGFTLALSSTTVAMGAAMKPLPNPNGTVVTWNAQNKTTLVATTDRRVYVIHGLRKLSPGTRVRVQGIKWGTPTRGIKWSKKPQGIKWGIKWARNGTFQARVTPTKAGKAKTLSLRARVIRRSGNRGVVLSIPGATLGLPAARRAVWIPRTTKRTKSGIGSFGSTIIVHMAVAPNGRVTMTKAQEVPTPPSQAAVPFAGTIISVNRTTGTMRVRVGGNGLTTVLTLSAPAGTDLKKLRVGTPVSGAARGTNPNRPLTVTQLAPNTSFGAADAPIVIPSSPTSPAPESTPPSVPGGGQGAAADERGPGGPPSQPPVDPPPPGGGDPDQPGPGDPTDPGDPDTPGNPDQPGADPSDPGDPPDPSIDPEEAPEHLRPWARWLHHTRITWLNPSYWWIFTGADRPNIYRNGRNWLNAAALSVNAGDVAAARAHLAAARTEVVELRDSLRYTNANIAQWAWVALARNWALHQRNQIDAIRGDLPD